MKSLRLLLAAVILCTSPIAAQQTQFPPSDFPANFAAPIDAREYVKHEVMIPMRDGVRLYTVIIYPKGLTNAPIVLTRKPYDGKSRANRMDSPHILSTLPLADEMFVRAGYIRVYQDIRGKYGSEGDYTVTRPVRGPLNPTETDHVTDAYDTIEWLVIHAFQNRTFGMGWITRAIRRTLTD